jgi:hypothetical protein
MVPTLQKQGMSVRAWCFVSVIVTLVPPQFFKFAFFYDPCDHLT